METDLLFALIIKHVICDLGLQSQFLWGQTHNKQHYFGCHLHYFHHGLGTLIVALFFVQPLLALTLSLIDYVAHWNIDFLKHRISNALGKTRKDKMFWWINSIDQGLHFLTYYLLVVYVTS